MVAKKAGWLAPAAPVSKQGGYLKSPLVRGARLSPAARAAANLSRSGTVLIGFLPLMVITAR